MDPAPTDDGDGVPGVQGIGLHDSGNTKPTPPTESPRTLLTRRTIVFSFWAIVLCLGLPHWLWTTSTYRASLPLSTMNDWAEGKACDLRFAFPIRVRVPGWTREEMVELSGSLSALLDHDGSDGLLDFTIHVGNADEEPILPAHGDPALTVVLHAAGSPDTNGVTSRLEPGESALHLGSGLRQAGEIADQIREITSPQQEALAYLLSGTPFAVTEHGALRATQNTWSEASLDARNTRAFKPSTTYHLSFSLFVSGNEPSAWAIEDALAAYMTPLLDALTGVSNFTVTTQVQLHASFSPSIAGPTFDEASGKWKLRKEDLSGFVNAAEWPLSPSIGEGSTINFVLYVPAPGHSPLVVADTGGTEWLVPQWGGVAILNLDEPTTPRKSTTDTDRTTLSAANLDEIMLTFADQLTALIGLPSSPAGSLALRIAALQRERATALLLSTASTLGALSRLVYKLPNIPIPDTVATSVGTSLRHLDHACQDLRAGRYSNTDTNLGALGNAQAASEASEKAFFEPSMVGQVYFPDEHKVAVYVPLLGPMVVPLVLAGVKELLGWYRGMRVKVKRT
ncbi:GPI transamidase component [Friedmanniomyces endolithicus]|uniref:GPI transamidase component n=1 Tax=Friedmanniomyces endolithicus TaxID=329885 RepID=A0AAN6J213_9PEZI|nr:GPI transamidase component [Friedmanniomyces endolithicus]KAK0289190.1 GPI transamidase component [Friedmanniomyces endolithicus]KAK0309643.1 GPI transamidase component [Friedmanniomyces endolithicus]KAK0982689.1 GPI transamidase component [Friedmanniomyces endolithicus]